MPKSPHPVPAYRRRSGYTQAIVTLTDAFTKKRRDWWLGEYGTPESREAYHRIIAEWEANGRRWPPSSSRSHETVGGPTVAEVMVQYVRWVQANYAPPSKATIFMALRIVRQLHGSTPAAEFGPNRLRLVRDQMVRGDPEATPPRKPWSRSTINKAVHQVVAMFKWAAAHEVLPAEVYHRLKTLGALRLGHTQARESAPIEPVPVERIDAIRPFLSRQVAALIDLQLHTGARGGELFKLRPIDIRMDDRSGVWTVELRFHKTAYRGNARTIFIGPRAQAVIRSFLANRPVDAYLFSPAEAEAERRARASEARITPLSCGNTPGSNRVAEPRKSPGAHYDSNSYRHAIANACDRAFPHPKGDAASERELAQWRKDHRWHPHQLRHTAATLIRREFGLEAARIALGHSSALVTDAVYAERDMEKVVEVMRRIG